MPAWNSQNVVYGAAFVETVLAAYKALTAVALVASGKIRLSKLPGFNPQPGATVASLEANEADFTGYTGGGYTCTLSAQVNVGVNIVGLTAAALPIAGTADPQVQNVIYGWWLDDGTNMVAAEAFPTGTTFAFNSPGDYLDLEIVLPFMFNQRAA